MKSKTKQDTLFRRKRTSFVRFLSVFKKVVEVEATAANKALAKEFVKEAKSVIEEQKYKWEPLKQDYLDWKVKHGYDPRTLVATGEIKDAISWGVVRGRIWAGLPRRIHTGSGLPLHILGRIHEFGTASIPARPLWRTLVAKFNIKKVLMSKSARTRIAKRFK